MEGGDHDLVQALEQGHWSQVQGLSPRELALCAVAEKLSATPTRMVAADWQPLRAQGFDDEACLEVAHIVGLFNYLTRLADGLGLRLDTSVQVAAASGVALKRAP